MKNFSAMIMYQLGSLQETESILETGNWRRLIRRRFMKVWAGLGKPQEIGQVPRYPGSGGCWHLWESRERESFLERVSWQELWLRQSVVTFGYRKQLPTAPLKGGFGGAAVLASVFSLPLICCWCWKLDGKGHLMQPYSSAFKATGCGGASGRHPAQKEPRDKETLQKPTREVAKGITRQFTGEEPLGSMHIWRHAYNH